MLVRKRLGRAGSLFAAGQRTLGAEVAMDAHCPRMAYKSVPTANRLVTQKEVGRVLEIHTRRLASIRQRKKHVSIDDSMPDVMKLRHMSRNMKRLQQQYGE